MGGVVDEHADGAEFRGGVGDGLLQRRNIAQVARDEMGRKVAGVFDLGDRLVAGLLVYVDEADFGALPAKILDNGGADAGAAAADEDDTILQTRVDGLSRHVLLSLTGYR